MTLSTAQRWSRAVAQTRPGVLLAELDEPAHTGRQAISAKEPISGINDAAGGRSASSVTATSSRSLSIRVASALIGIAILLLVVGAAWWWSTGGRWMIVASPSMGQASPVGTMVFTRPVTAAQLHVGDIISFRSPLNPGEIYTHRVVAIDPAGGLHTRGDINGATDPAALHTKDIVGKVVARWWAMGWLIRASPVLLIGALLLWVVTRRWANDHWRIPLRVFGGSVLVALAAAMLQPFAGFVVLAQMPTGTGIDLTLVSTGILPLRLTATGGAHLDLVDGQLATLAGSGPAGPNGYTLTSTLHLNLRWWLTLFLIWATPLLVALLSKRHQLSRPTDPPADPRVDSRADPAGNKRRPHPPKASKDLLVAIDRSAPLICPDPPHPASTPTAPVSRWHRFTQGRRKRHLLLLPVTVVVVAMSITPTTAGAYTAKITNSTDTTATAPYFTCLAAAAAYNPFLSYPLNDAVTTNTAPAADVSGNTRTGTYGTNITPSTSNPCSKRDTTGSILLSGTGTTTSVQTPTQVTNPTVFTETIRFKTTTGGGRLIGFGNLATGTSTSYDRHLYLTNTGQVVFGVYSTAVFTVISPGTYLDGNWHQATATLSGAGMILYLDGAQVATNTTNTAAQNYAGYWRIGYDTLANWGTTTPTNFYYTGNLAYAATYTTALTPAQIKALYTAGT